MRVTSSLLLSLIINEDEDNLLALNTTGLDPIDWTTTVDSSLLFRSDVLPLLSGMIQMYNSADQRFYGFSFTELVDGLSKLMVRGRTYKYIDQNLVDILLKYLEDANQDTSLIECVSSAILNASFDEKVQSFLDSDRAIKIITTAQNKTGSELVQKNCEAILWTLNRIPHRRETKEKRAKDEHSFRFFQVCRRWTKTVNCKVTWWFPTIDRSRRCVWNCAIDSKFVTNKRSLWNDGILLV